jgi:hypothetical protein
LAVLCNLGTLSAPLMDGVHWRCHGRCCLSLSPQSLHSDVSQHCSQGRWLVAQPKGAPPPHRRSSPPDAKTKEPTSWQTLTASVAPLLTPLSNLSDLPVKWGISKQDVDIGEQDLHTKSKDGRFSCQLENSRFFGLLLTSVISSILVVAEQQI